MTLRRKTAISTWDPQSDSSIYAKVVIDCTNAKKFIEDFNSNSSNSNDSNANVTPKITVTHLVGKALALALREYPSINGRIVFGKYLPNKSVDVCFLVSIEGQNKETNLAPTVLRNVDKMTLKEVAQGLVRTAKNLRTGKDDDFKKNMDLVKSFPTFLLSTLGTIVGILGGDLLFEIPPLGIKARPFGSCMITNVGMFDVEEAYAPMTPFSRLPLLVLLSSIKDKPTVVNNEITIRPIMNVCATMDHRYIDGFDGAKLSHRLKQYMENPETIDKIYSEKKTN